MFALFIKLLGLDQRRPRVRGQVVAEMAGLRQRCRGVCPIVRRLGVIGSGTEDLGTLQFTLAPLCLRREGADGVDFVTEEFQTIGGYGVGRKDIQNAASAREFPRLLDGLRPPEPVIDQPGRKIVRRNQVSSVQDAPELRQHFLVGNRLNERLDRCQNEAGRLTFVEQSQDCADAGRRPRRTTRHRWARHPRLEK